MNERYNKTHKYGDIEYSISNVFPDLDQCKFLILKVLEQAIRDYISFFDSKINNERLIWDTANDFIFNDDYVISWGELELSTEEFLYLVELNIEWVREHTKKKLEKRKGTNG